MPPILNRLLSDERAATAIEYTIIAALISVAAVTSMTTLGQTLLNTLSNVATSFP
jgi:pilus assembly protein Flp/PilA